MAFRQTLAATLGMLLVFIQLHYTVSAPAEISKTTPGIRHSIASQNTAGNTTKNSTASCVKCRDNSTDPDSCGSCTFANGNFCGWTSYERYGYTWSSTDDGWIYVDTDWSGNREKAVLISPVMCQRKGDIICLTFRYSFSFSPHGRLSAEICSTDCEDFFTVTKSDSDWHTQSIEFTAPGHFLIHFIGDKSYDGVGPESDIFLDDIVYKQGPCDGATSPISTIPPAGNKTMYTTEVDSPSSAISTRDQDDSTHWTTQGEPVREKMEEVGSGDDLAKLRPGSGDRESKRRADREKTLAVGAVKIVAPVAVGLLALIIGTTIAVVIQRRRENSRRNADDTQQGAVQYQKKESIEMVYNDLYHSVDMAASGSGNGLHQKKQLASASHLVLPRTADGLPSRTYSAD